MNPFPPKSFIELIAEIGNDFSLVQGQGGNCSFKNQDEMLVKSSGFSMGAVREPGFFYRVGIKGEEYHEIDSTQVGRPSIEVWLHAALPHRVVIHLHSTKAVALSLVMPEVLKDETPLGDVEIRLVGYETPGAPLRDLVLEHAPWSKKTVLVLENHGSVVAAESVEDALDTLIKFEAYAESKLNDGLGVSLNPGGLGQSVSPSLISRLRWHTVNNWRISPDHVVFLGEDPPTELVRTLDSGKSLRVNDLISCLDKGKGRPRSHSSIEQLLWFINVVQYLQEKTYRTLSRIESKKLLAWEAEKYRVGNSGS